MEQSWPLTTSTRVGYVIIMKLEHYLNERGESVAMFCLRSRIRSRNTIYRYLRGERRPSPEYVQRIKTATGGMVTLLDWYDE